jgi:hypothetical protein
LASRHRGNDMMHAARAKNAAIEALVSATSPGLDSDASIEHIATGLVLCLVEVSRHLEENGTELTRYFHGDRQISTATGLAIYAGRKTLFLPSIRKHTPLEATQLSFSGGSTTLSHLPASASVIGAPT